MSIAAKIERTAAPVTDDILIGKDILELLTGAMYVDPLCVYREYVQNAVDSIEDATDAAVYTSADRPGIDIWIDAKARSVRIRDNGVGLPKSEFVRRLTAIGASTKRGRPRRGFRGVGRLAGLGFCHELIFRSRVFGEDVVSELSWDGRKLREALRNLQANDDLITTMRAVVTRATVDGAGYPPRFFEVELRNVSRIKNDQLLNSAAVRSYLSQVAPVPFSDSFPFRTEIDEFLQQHKLGFTCPITLHDGLGPVQRSFGEALELRANRHDRFTELQTFVLPGINDDTAAVGWVAHSNYLGSIPKTLGVGGLRLRVNNIQIGTSELTSSLFQEPRFNEWCVGEFHVVTKTIVPNGRRDDFEASNSYQNLQSHLAVVAKQVTKACRNQSGDRTRLVRARALADKIDADLRSLRIWANVAPLAPRHLSDVHLSILKLEKLVAAPGLDARAAKPLRLRVPLYKAAFESLSDRRSTRRKSVKPERTKLARELLEAINKNLAPSRSSDSLAAAVLKLALSRK